MPNAPSLWEAVVQATPVASHAVGYPNAPGAWLAYSRGGCVNLPPDLREERVAIDNNAFFGVGVYP